jgi:hypothetical protein
LCSHHGREYALWRFLKNVKIELSQKLVIPPQGIYPKIMTSVCQRHSCTSTFVAVLFTVSDIWNQPSVHELRNEESVCYVYKMEPAVSVKKDVEPGICENMAKSAV